MKASLAPEGWKENRRLPKGWRIKDPAPSSSTEDPKNPLKFLNEEADELNAEEALEYLAWQNHSEEDLQGQKNFASDILPKFKFTLYHSIVSPFVTGSIEALISTERCLIG